MVRISECVGSQSSVISGLPTIRELSRAAARSKTSTAATSMARKRGVWIIGSPAVKDLSFY